MLKHMSRNTHDFCKTMHLPVDLLHMSVSALDFTTGQVVFGPCPAFFPLAPQKKIFFRDMMQW